MSGHRELTTDLRARAVDYVLGAMSGAERGPYESHLAECPICRDEVEALRALGGRLEAECPAVPTESLWKRIGERTRRGPRPGPFFAQDVPDAWVDGPLPGIRLRHLHTDEENDRVTYLVRAEAGIEFPAHVHHGPEECYVIEGELFSGNVRMPAGDYQFAEAGSHHEPQRCPTGCLLLLVSSRQDALISA